MKLGVSTCTNICSLVSTEKKRKKNSVTEEEEKLGKVTKDIRY